MLFPSKRLTFLGLSAHVRLSDSTPVYAGPSSSHSAHRSWKKAPFPLKEPQVHTRKATEN